MCVCAKPTDILEQHGLSELHRILHRAQEVAVGQFDDAKVAVDLHVAHPLIGLTLVWGEDAGHDGSQGDC